MVRARSAVFVAAFAALAVVGLGRSAQAQADSTASARRLRVNASAIQPGQFIYQTTLERDAGTMILGTRTVSLAPTTYAGSPALLLVETRAGDGIPAADSLFAAVSDLRPLHWSAFLGGARLSAEFRGDTLFGATSAPSGRRSIVAQVPAGSLVNAAMLESILRVLPLQPSWEDSTNTLSVALSGNAVIPTRLSVIGEDRVRVPAGTFDCWVVAVHADQSRGLYWVTKRDPIVVRSALDVPTLGGAQLVSSLTRIGR